MSTAADRPAVAIFRAPVFNRSETFIQRQAASLTRYRPVIVGLKHSGPVDPALAEVVIARTRERLALLAGNAGPLSRRLADFGPRLIHAHFGPDGLAALPLAEALGIPLVTTLHGYDVSRSRVRLLAAGRLSWLRYALRGHRLMAKGALFLAVSKAVRERALRRGFPKDRTVVHRIGVDLARFRPSEVNAEPGLILHVGRLVEKKGTGILLDAVARLGDGAGLVIIGDGPLRRVLEAQAGRLGLSGKVRFLGEQPPDIVLQWLRRATVLAAPSVTASDGDAEGLPTVIVEALACGVPVVATDHSGNPEAVLDGRTGFLVPERDAEALAARMGQVLDDPAMRRTMAAAARRLAEEQFDLARQTAALESLYDTLLGQRHKD